MNSGLGTNRLVIAIFSPKDGLNFTITFYFMVSFQLHKRVAECVKLLSVLEEINLGFHNKQVNGSQNSSILYGKDFDWTQLKVSYRFILFLINIEQFLTSYFSDFWYIYESLFTAQFNFRFISVIRVAGKELNYGMKG